MSQRQKQLLISITFTILALQIGHTLFDRVTWPFCPHNFYYHKSEKVKGVFRVGLIDDHGNTQIVECRHTLPVEGYRCGSIYREIFIENEKEKRKRDFCQMVLSRLNRGGWKAFDERWAPALPQKGATYVGLAVERHSLDTRHYRETAEIPTVKKELLYTYLK